MYESGETYLETILILSQKHGYVRAVDVARELGYSKPSVSRAMGLLKDSGHITISEHGEIKLTDIGSKKAQSIYERHQLITRFLLMTTGVSEEIAETDACRMEHIISDDIFRGMQNYIEQNKQK